MPKAQPFRGPVVVSGVTFCTKKSLGKYVEDMRDANQCANEKFKDKISNYNSGLHITSISSTAGGCS